MSLFEKLQLLQERCGYLPQEELAALAKEEGCSLAEVVGTASFYEFFRFNPEAESSVIEALYPCRLAGPLLNERCDTLLALAKAKADPDGALAVIKEATLKGRGGGGFPTGEKWEMTKNVPGRVKYVVCNADEGEPGTGKDRVILERNPTAVLEGMAICAAIIGAEEGYVYLRGEYADLKQHLEKAIDALALDGFAIHVRLGMGAYVCGEETALLESLESKRGEPRLKPPYPGAVGYRGCPTVINNAETFACVPGIVRQGADSFRANETRLYTVSGCVRQPGVYECRSGITVAELLTLAGGSREELRAVLLGGGSGSLMGLDVLDLPMSPEDCVARGAVFGTASLRFVGESEDLVCMVRDLIAFYGRESCGMCVPCRVGLKRLGEMLNKAKNCRLWPDELEELRSLCEHIRGNARCGLGQAAVTPVLTLIKNFPEVLT